MELGPNSYNLNPQDNSLNLTRDGIGYPWGFIDFSSDFNKPKASVPMNKFWINNCKIQEIVLNSPSNTFILFSCLYLELHFQH